MALALVLRLSSDAVVDGAADVLVIEETMVLRDHQTSFINFSSKSEHGGIKLSRSSDHMTRTHSSRPERRALFLARADQVAHCIEYLNSCVGIGTCIQHIRMVSYTHAGAPDFDSVEDTDGCFEWRQVAVLVRKHAELAWRDGDRLHFI
ncbi:hypothetical protein ARMGADRAFT_1082573 [Armillaria gallica]|uniref:Uncharacterized protein n=1 Tax=Armillaria gallica TaxID=47427 RepID=A0A2H3DP52_ARMGA|nr:hypothetical protein ARMGADRAFT_1082573 [Armillaria gallica]